MRGVGTLEREKEIWRESRTLQQKLRKKFEFELDRNKVTLLGGEDYA